MIFSSVTFAVFFCIVAGCILCTQLPFVVQRFSPSMLLKVRHAILLAASYVFYGWWDWRFCFLMLTVTSIAYISARNINKPFFRVFGIVTPLVVLGIFKYFNFFLDSFGVLVGISRLGSLNIILPVGISFYTFQAMSYTLDVAMGRLEATSFMDLALYIAFFPQLVAGPIVKAGDFLPQLKENRLITFKNCEKGMQIFLFGLAKKIVVADHLAVFVDSVFATPLAYHSATIVLAVVSYSIQIYLDFSGYSDMAIGAALCFGYEFEQNFNMPYIAKDVSEFWKRWHISLSSFLQQYLYIPLGGNRHGTIRTYANLIITMVLGGLWHGANWTFVVWGTLHGVALCVHRVFRSMSWKAKPSRLNDALSMVATYTFVCICWIFFRAETLEDAVVILGRVFSWSEGIVHPYIWSWVAMALVGGATFIAMRKFEPSVDARGREILVSGFCPVMDLTKISSLTVFLFSWGVVLGLMYTGGSPFIYFQF